MPLTDEQREAIARIDADQPKIPTAKRRRSMTAVVRVKPSELDDAPEPAGVKRGPKAKS